MHIKNSLRAIMAVIMITMVFTVTLAGCTSKSNEPQAMLTPTAAAATTPTIAPTSTASASQTAASTATPTAGPTSTSTQEPTLTPIPTSTAATGDPCAQVQCAAGYYCLNGTCTASSALKPIPDVKIALLSVCGDGICSASENASGSCCNDCGCPAGYACSNNSCIVSKITPPFKPIIIMPVFPSKETIISPNSSGSVLTPAIDGNKVVFVKYVAAMKPRVEIYDISTKTLTQLPHDEDSYNPDICGGRIVFEDSSILPSEGSSIYYYSLTEGVEGLICPRDCYQQAPKIFNYAIVWSEPNYLRFYWLPGQEERNIYHVTGQVQGSYDIWGGYVAYILASDCHGSCKYTLYLYDIATGDTQTIYSTSGYIGDVAIRDSKIAYTIGTDQYSVGIYIYDIATKLTTKATTIASDKEGIAMYGNTVVWSDHRNGNYDIYMYNLSTSTETRVSSDSHDESYPDISGNFIVYQRGNTDIVLYKID